METQNPSINCAKKSGGYTLKGKELKPNLISLVIEKRFDSSSQLGKQQIFCVSQPKTILSFPMIWTTRFNTELNEMQDRQFPIIKYKYPI